MKPMDDVWEHISSLPSLHHPTTTHHFQDFFAPPPRTSRGAIIYQPSPPKPPPSVPPLTTVLSLNSTSGNSGEYDQEPTNTNSIVVTSPNVIIVKQTSPPEYTEKFKRLMKNRESAARSRARKQARVDELELEVLRLTKENTKLKRLYKERSIEFMKYGRLDYWWEIREVGPLLGKTVELCSASTAQVPKKPRLHRSKSAPL